MKPYQQIPIIECHEPLIKIPEEFAVVSPHPYQKLGATYGARSPDYLRQSVVGALAIAQAELQKHFPQWRILIFDAYRPVEVQQFMVDYTFNQVVQAMGFEAISALQQQRIWEQVYQLWAVPNWDERYPPPHSTGAAIDITLIDGTGKIVDMGSEIDELSPRSHPNYYADSTQPQAQQYHAHRQMLHNIMRVAGFMRHPGEWWHFCLGDQMWAYLTNQTQNTSVIARYGRID